MKVTDYIPRATPFLTQLKGEKLFVIEIGSDVGAHAHALLKYAPIQHLWLVDIWDREFYRGYCEGRLYSHGFKSRVSMIQSDGLKASQQFSESYFDAIYVDITHDYATVKASLELWWPKLKVGGLFGYRNYSNSNINNKELNQAIDEFVKKNQIQVSIELGEILLYKKK